MRCRDKSIRLGRHYIGAKYEQGGPHSDDPPSTVAHRELNSDAFQESSPRRHLHEAVLGAIYLDRGLIPARTFVMKARRHIVCVHISWQSIVNEKALADAARAMQLGNWIQLSQSESDK
jgi:hypothetical protein